MSLSGDQWIQIHNERIESDEQYREEYFREEEENRRWFFFGQGDGSEKQTDFFPELKIDHTGYTEHQEAMPIPMPPNDDDLPF